MGSGNKHGGASSHTLAPLKMPNLPKQAPEASFTPRGSHEPRLSVGRYAHKVALATALCRVKAKPRGIEEFLASPSGMMLK